MVGELIIPLLVTAMVQLTCGQQGNVKSTLMGNKHADTLHYSLPVPMIKHDHH